MPYADNRGLPLSVQGHLPEEAQEIYREVFNHAWRQYTEDPRQEEIAHRVAWAAVNRQFAKAGDQWVPR